jgi:hypothetical protein
LIASAVAAAIGAGSSYALPPGSLAGATVLYAAGGSAQANAFYVAVADNLVQSPTCSIDSYTDTTTGADSGSYRVLTGTTSAAITSGSTTIAAGTNIIYMYKFNGGSYANGIAPQLASGATTLAYPTVASIQAAAAVSGAVAGAGCTAGTPTYQYTANAGTTGVAPDWGVADVEVGMFTGYNNPTGNAGGTVKNTNGGSAPAVGASTGLYDNLFGIAVTHNVYTGAHPKTNFSRAEVEGIIEGTISDWSQLYADDGTVLAAGGIVFLDRGEGSGSKASGNQYFLCYPGCGASARLPLSANAAYTGARATISETSQDVAEASNTNLVADLKLLQAGGVRGIGVLGMEFPPHANQVSGTNTYDFVKINGVAADTGALGDDINGPTATSYVNVVKGNYDYYYQNSFNTRTGFLTCGASSPGCAFANKIKTTMTSPGFVGADVGGKFPQGVGGTLLDADSASTLTKGMTMNTRNKISTAPLQPKLSPVTPFPVSSDPL